MSEETGILLSQFLTKTYHFSTEGDRTTAMEMGRELFDAGEAAGSRAAFDAEADVDTKEKKE